MTSRTHEIADGRLNRLWKNWLILPALVLVAILQCWLLWGSNLPLGVPGEWTWARVDWKPFDAFGLVVPLMVGGVLVSYVHWNSRQIEGWSSGRQRLALLGLWLLGVGWFFALVSAVPEPAGTSRFPFVLYYARTSGYFFEARHEVEQLGPFLRDYEASITESTDSANYLHRGTHPPGLVAGYRLMLDAVHASESLRAVLLSTEPVTIRQAMGTIRTNERHSGRLVTEDDEATLWLATLLTVSLAALTVWPLFRILSLTTSPMVAWYGAALWLTVPAVAVFLPKSDAAFPFLAIWAQWCWLESLRRRSFLWGAATGFVLLISLLLTLAFVPLGLIFILQFLFDGRSSRHEVVAKPVDEPYVSFRSWRSAIGATCVFVLGLASLWLILRVNLLAIWVQNLKNHAEFYDHFTRTYLTWLWVNPLELAVSIGAPLALLSVWGLCRRRSDNRSQLAAALVWMLLWFSGKNMGEAARLWIFLMPYAVWFAGSLLQRVAERMERSRLLFTMLFCLQMIVCVLTVIRIDGFHFGELQQ